MPCLVTYKPSVRHFTSPLRGLLNSVGAIEPTSCVLNSRKNAGSGSIIGIEQNTLILPQTSDGIMLEADGP